MRAPGPASAGGRTRRFTGRVALVVGGGSDGPAAPGDTVAMGNGRAIAHRLAAEGAVVAVTDLDPARAKLTVDSMAGEGLALAADASDPEQCRAAVRQVETELGPIDVVIGNVGIGGAASIRRQSVEQWDLAMAVNARSHWVTAAEALGPMLERGHGAFVFVSSVAAATTNGFALSYEASKAAQQAVSRHIAARYARRGIRSNTVVLGYIDSPMARREQGSAASTLTWRNHLPAAERQGRPDEVAAAVAFLASDDASYVNGTELLVDGGLSVRSPDALFRGADAPFELPLPRAGATS